MSRDYTGELARKLREASIKDKEKSAELRGEDLRMFFGFREDTRIWERHSRESNEN